MGHYQLLHAFSRDRNTAFCDEYELYSLPEDAPLTGKKISDWNSRVCFYFTDGEPEDYLDNILVWPLFSHSLRTVFDNSNDDCVQFLPVGVENKSTGYRYTYYVANVIAVTDAMDMRHSRFTTFPDDGVNRIIAVTHFALKASVVGDIDILRVNEYLPALFISERAREMLLRSRISGCDVRAVKVL